MTILLVISVFVKGWKIGWIIYCSDHSEEKASLLISAQAAASKECYKTQMFLPTFLLTSNKTYVPNCLLMLVKWLFARGSVSCSSALASMEAIPIAKIPDSNAALPMLPIQNVMLKEVLNLPFNKNLGLGPVSQDWDMTFSSIPSLSICSILFLKAQSQGNSASLN